jgi:copper(I)-binding protein
VIPLSLLACTVEGEPLVLVSGWAMAGPSAGAATAVYLRVRNPNSADDRLLGAETALAERAELHQTREEEGMVRMVQVPALTLPGQGELALQPGGAHLMLMGLRQPLAEGQELELELRFERAGELMLRLPVRPAGSPAP